MKTYTVSNKKDIRVLALLFAIMGFMLAFFSAPFILQSVFGITPNDPGYRQYFQNDGTPNTPYQDFIANGCLREPNTGVEKTLVFDTNGLVELGMFWFDPNTCFDMAMAMTDQYNIDSVEKDSNGQMIITLTKK